MKKILLRYKILYACLISICPLINGQCSLEKVIYKRESSVFTFIIGTYTKSYITILSDSTYLIFEQIYFVKKAKKPHIEKTENGYWKIEKDTLLLYTKENDLSQEKFLVKKRKLIKVGSYPNYEENNYRSQKFHFRLWRWKRITPKKSSYKIQVNKNY